MATFICPYCYGEHELKDCAMKCNFNKDKDNTICPDGVPKGSDGTTDGWIDKKYYSKCLNKCTKATKEIYCPNTYKFAQGFAPIIPIRCIQEKSLPIALIGAKATGKSNYICVLINEIRRRMSLGFGTVLYMSGVDDVTTSTYNDLYYRPLYKEKMQISATDSGEVPPMIFPIDFPNKKSVTLTIYDTAGENLDSKTSIEMNNGYIPHSQGIIMLLDPLQLDAVRDKLGDKALLPEQNTSPFDVLDMVINNIEGMLGIKAGKKFDIPLAVVFTKMDALEEYEDLFPADSNLRLDSEHVEKGAFIMDEFENTQKEMEDILSNVLGDYYSDFYNKINRFKSHAIFGVSALGVSPDAEGRLPGGVKPRRVLDPLLWILKEHKYIKVIK